MRGSLQTRSASGTASDTPGGTQVRPARLTTNATATAHSTPTSAPASPSKKPSMMNRVRMPPRRSPMARNVPISTVRSTTAVFIVLLTLNSTMAPINTKMKPKMVSNN